MNTFKVKLAVLDMTQRDLARLVGERLRTCIRDCDMSRAMKGGKEPRLVEIRKAAQDILEKKIAESGQSEKELVNGVYSRIKDSES